MPFYNMPFTVSSAFNRFCKDVVDLPTDTTEKARTSRDYLFQQINNLAKNSYDFPCLYSGIRSFMPFGSFARKTKIRPLDDIDVLVLLSGYGTSENKLGFSAVSKLTLTEWSSPLSPFIDNSGYVNSTKILNKIKTNLFSVSNYRKAEVRKNMQVVCLNLMSYDWSFDVVPAIPINLSGSIDYYLIPDGYGKWMKTDPRIDAQNITNTNLKHNGKFLGLMRLLKYWNSCCGLYYKPRLGSYYFETLVIKVFSNLYADISNFPSAVIYFFQQCPYYLMSPCADPKRLGGNLDANVSLEEKIKLKNYMSSQLQVAQQALDYEKYSRHREAIIQWQNIFGKDFPSYG